MRPRKLAENFVQALEDRGELLKGGAARLRPIIRSDAKEAPRDLPSMVAYLCGNGSAWLTPDGKTALKAPALPYLIHRLDLRGGEAATFLETWALDAAEAALPVGTEDGTDKLSPHARTLAAVARFVAGRMTTGAHDESFRGGPVARDDVSGVRSLCAELQSQGFIREGADLDRLAGLMRDTAGLDRRAAVKTIVSRLKMRGWEEFSIDEPAYISEAMDYLETGVGLADHDAEPISGGGTPKTGRFPSGRASSWQVPPGEAQPGDLENHIGGY